MASSEFSDVFISYRRKDVEFTQQIVDELKKVGKEVWVDWEDIPPGSEGFTDDIKRGLEGSDAFLCILSPNYLESTYCVDMELGYALQLKKKIIPVVLEKFEGQPIPAGIGHINWIYFTPHAGQANTFDQSFPKIAQALDQDLAHARMHKRIALRALEWDTKSRSRSYLLSGDEISEAEDWISHASDKVPETTDLHADYVSASRRQATQRQRQLLAGVSVALAVSLILMVVAVALGFEANNQRVRAEDNEKIAVRQADISQSIALASGAMEANTRDQIQAVALAVESVNLTDPPGIGQRVLGTVAYQPGAVRVFEGHTGFATAVAFSPDGKTAVSASEDTTLIVWDVATGEALHTLTGHTESVDHVAFSPDGTMIASAAEDETIKLWDAATGTEIRILTGHTHWVLSVAFSPDGQRLVSSSRDETLVIWNTKTGEMVQPLNGHTDRVVSVAFSPDGTMIASASRDDTIILWDAATGDILHTLIGHTADLSSISFSLDSTRLVSGGYDNAVYVWDTATGEQTHSFLRHTRPVNTVAFGIDGHSVFSGSEDRTIIWWTLNSEDPLHTFTGLDFVRSVAPGPDGRWLISADRTNNLILWDLRAGNVLQEFTSPGGAINAAALSPDSQLIAIGTDDQQVVVYEAAAGAVHSVRSTLTGHETYVTAVAFSTDSRWLASGDDNGVIRIWDLTTSETIHTFTEDQPIHSLAFTPDNKNLLAGSGAFVDGLMNLWDIEIESKITEFSGSTDDSDFTGTVWGAVLSPDGKLAAAAWEDGLSLWDVATGQHLRSFTGHTAAVRSVAFSPDSSRLISGSFDHQVMLWDVASGSLLHTFSGHGESVRSVAFNADGRLIASGADDDTVMIWDTLTGDAISTYTGHWDNIYSIAFSADGKQLISGGKDGRAILWQVNTLPELIDWTKSHRYLATLDCITRREYGLECTTEENS